MAELNIDFDLSTPGGIQFPDRTALKLSAKAYSILAKLYDDDHALYHHMCVKASNFIVKACNEQSATLDVDLVLRQALVEILQEYPLN